MCAYGFQVGSSCQAFRPKYTHFFPHQEWYMLRPLQTALFLSTLYLTDIYIYICHHYHYYDWTVKQLYAPRITTTISYTKDTHTAEVYQYVRQYFNRRKCEGISKLIENVADRQWKLSRTQFGTVSIHHKIYFTKFYSKLFVIKKGSSPTLMHIIKYSSP
jgi:hypothetical protein